MLLAFFLLVVGANNAQVVFATDSAVDAQTCRSEMEDCDDLPLEADSHGWSFMQKKNAKHLKLARASTSDVAQPEDAIAYVRFVQGESYTSAAGAVNKIMSRPQWIQTLRCTNTSSKSCEPCADMIYSQGSLAGDALNCWGSDGDRRKIKWDGSGSWTRFVNVIHVRCAEETLQLSLQFSSIKFGKVSSFWDHSEIESTISTYYPLQIPFIDSDDSFGWHPACEGSDCVPLQARLELDMYGHAGGHTFELVFEPLQAEAETSLRALTFEMPAIFADCEDNKVCLNALYDAGQEGLALRNNNTLQLQCLETEEVVSNACTLWKDCLHQSVDESGTHYDQRILTLLHVAILDSSSDHFALQNDNCIDDSEGMRNYFNVNPSTTSCHDVQQYCTALSGYRRAILWGFCPTTCGRCMECTDDTSSMASIGLQPQCSRYQSYCNSDNPALAGSVALVRGLCPATCGVCNAAGAGSALELKLGASSHTSNLLASQSKIDLVQLEELAKPDDAFAELLQHLAETSAAARVHKLEDSCIYPPHEDPESWNCDCLDEATELCAQVQASHSISLELCLRAAICSKDDVCEDWITENCATPNIQQAMSILEQEDSALLQRAGLVHNLSNSRSNVSGNRSQNLDASFQGHQSMKSCG